MRGAYSLLRPFRHKANLVILLTSAMNYCPEYRINFNVCNRGKDNISIDSALFGSDVQLISDPNRGLKTAFPQRNYYNNFVFTTISSNTI